MYIFSGSDIIHLLDSAEPDIRFVLQIEADVGRREANINLDLHNKSNVRGGSVQQMFYYAPMLRKEVSSLSLHNIKLFVLFTKRLLELVEP